jgi:hypothetical protein
MSQAKNNTGLNRTQHLRETQPIDFNNEFMDSKLPTVSQALGESSTLLSSCIALITQLSAEGPVTEEAAYGIIFILGGAKALLDSTVVNVRHASAQVGVQ